MHRSTNKEEKPEEFEGLYDHIDGDYTSQIRLVQSKSTAIFVLIKKRNNKWYICTTMSVQALYKGRPVYYNSMFNTADGAASEAAVKRAAAAKLVSLEELAVVIDPLLSDQSMDVSSDKREDYERILDLLGATSNCRILRSDNGDVIAARKGLEDEDLSKYAEPHPDEWGGQGRQDWGRD